MPFQMIPSFSLLSCELLAPVKENPDKREQHELKLKDSLCSKLMHRLVFLYYVTL